MYSFFIPKELFLQENNEDIFFLNFDEGLDVQNLVKNVFYFKPNHPFMVL